MGMDDQTVEETKKIEYDRVSGPILTDFDEVFGREWPMIADRAKLVLTGAPLSQIRPVIVEAARSYVGVPFRHQGRTRSGLDCVGLIVRVAHDLGISNDDFTAYGRAPDGRIFQEKLNEYLEKRLDSVIEPGDVLSFALPRYPCHVAIATGENRIIHALSSVGRVVENRIDSGWRKRFRGAYSFKGMELWRSWR